MSSSAIAFFTPAKKPATKDTPAERRAKARKAKARANTKSEEALIRAYIHADPVQRKQILLDQAHAVF